VPAFARRYKGLEQEVEHLDRLNQQLEADIASWDALAARHTFC